MIWGYQHLRNPPNINQMAWNHPTWMTNPLESSNRPTEPSLPIMHHSRLWRWKNSEKNLKKDRKYPSVVVKKTSWNRHQWAKKKSIATKKIQNNWKSNTYHLAVHKKRLENGSIPRCVGNSWTCLRWCFTFSRGFHDHFSPAFGRI